MPLQVVCVPGNQQFNHLVACSDMLRYSKKSLRRLKLVANRTYALAGVHAPISMHLSTAQAERMKASHPAHYRYVACKEIEQHV